MIIANSQSFATDKTPAVLDGRLGNTAKLRAAFPGHERVIGKYKLQATAARLLPDERVSYCMRTLNPGKRGVEVVHTPGHGSSYRGLMTCGSAWACPVCASRVTEARRAELQAALETWRGFAVMAAFTLQHDRDDRLADLLVDLKAAFQALARDRQVRKLKAQFGIIGTVSAFEVTYGAAGWHPHKHVLFLSERELSTDEIRTLEREISARYRSILQKRGRFGGESCAVVFTAGGTNQAAAAYVTKGTWSSAAELTKAPVKAGRSGNRSPFELLAAAETDRQAAALFKEYFYAFKGTHQVQYSRGLRALLGLGLERSDEEIAAVEDEGVVLAVIAPDVWRVICQRELRGDLLAAAADGSVERLSSWMSEQGFSPGYQ